MLFRREGIDGRRTCDAPARLLQLALLRVVLCGPMCLCSVLWNVYREARGRMKEGVILVIQLQRRPEKGCWTQTGDNYFFTTCWRASAMFLTVQTGDGRRR